ncbi:MAG: phage tail protein [Bacillaceae bacterium]|nr:phage tail protein [Bacillaceae bacterium]
MYSITIYDGPNDNKGMLIHSPFVDGLKVEGQIDLVAQGISSMTIKINASNPAWNKVKPLFTLIRVLNVKTNKTVFEGRFLKPTQTMNADGMATIEYACEGKLAYLTDSHQRYGKFQGISIKDFFTHMIEVHNNQVEQHKRFKVGNVSVANNTDNLYRFVGYENTFDEIKGNLIDRLGGFLVLREEVDGTYIDYLSEIGEKKNTPIRLRTNLKDMRRDIDPTHIITRVIPLGAREEPAEGEPADASMPRLDMKSINNGLDYLEDKDLIGEFGVIEGTIIYDDINVPSFLLLRAQQFFENQKAARVSYDITPVNLDLIDTSFEPFEVGNKHPIINPIFRIDEELQIIAKSIDLNNPQLDRLTFGEKYRTLTEYQIEATKKAKRVVELESDVNRQTQTINTLRVELQQVDQAVQQVKFELEDGDLPALEDAIDNLNQAVDNLINAIDDIPVYDLATPTSKGLMSSSDKTKLNSLKSYDMATETKEGLMSAGDKKKLNLIKVTSLVDLDDLLARVEALENANGEPE